MKKISIFKIYHTDPDRFALLILAVGILIQIRSSSNHSQSLRAGFGVKQTRLPSPIISW